jgi:hypothetical protein
MLTLPCRLSPRGDTLDLLAALSWRTAFVPIPGPRPLVIALSSDQRGCLSLGAALFACDAKAVDLEMIDDTLRELVNMIGGQVRTAVVQDQSLGLPRIGTGDDAGAGDHLGGGDPGAGAAGARCIVLTAGAFELAVRVLEGGPSAAGARGAGT